MISVFIDNSYIIILVTQDNVHGRLLIFQAADHILGAVCGTVEVGPGNLSGMFLRSCIKGPAGQGTARLSNGLTEVLHRDRREHVVGDTGAACTLSHDGDFVRVSAKMSNVLVNPLQSQLLIQQTHVPCQLIIWQTHKS